MRTELERATRAVDIADRVYGVVLVLVAVLTVVACIVAPLQGNWSPDVGVGIALAAFGVLALLDKILLP